MSDLLAQTATGNLAAFERLYDLMSAGIYGLVLRVVRDPDQAREVTQEAFVEFWSSAGKYDPRRGSARAWMFTIAHRRAVDLVRKTEASRRRDRVAASRSMLPADGDVVGDLVGDRDDRHRVRTALGELTALEREAVEMAYYGGNTYREVAEQLNVPLGTVKTRMRSALMRLGDILEDNS